MSPDLLPLCPTGCRHHGIAIGTTTHPSLDPPAPHLPPAARCPAGYHRGVAIDTTNATDVDHDVEVVGWGEEEDSGLK